MSNETEPKENIVLFCHPKTAAYILNITDNDEHKAAFASRAIIGTVFPEDDHLIYVVDVDEFVEFINDKATVISEDAEAYHEDSEEDTNDTAGDDAEDSEPVENG